MSETSSQNIDSEKSGDTSPTSDPSDIPNVVLRSAAEVFAFVIDDKPYDSALEVTEELDDELVKLAETCAAWSDASGHEGLAREAFRADAYIEMLERVLTSLALDSRLAKK